MKQVAIVVLLTFYLMSSYAQNFVGWNEHLPYRKATQLLASSDRIYCLTESGVFYYSLNDNEIRPFSKTNTLSDSDVSAISWSADQNLLIVGYRNGNIDLISENSVFNISDIKNFAGFGNKEVNSIHSRGDIAYLSTSFGIVVLNLEKQEIADTYLIGANGSQLQVNEIITSDSEIWAATENGIYQADLNSSNLADFNNWQFVSEIPNSTRACVDLELIGTDLFVMRNVTSTASEIYKLSNQNWSEFLTESNLIHSIKSSNSGLYVVLNELIKEYNASGNKLSDIANFPSYSFRDVVSISNRIFIADFEKSLLELEGNDFTQIKPDGPLRSEISAVYSAGDQTWAAAGIANADLPAELYLLSDSEWKNFTADEVPEFVGKTDINNISGNKRNEARIYAGTWGDGLFEFQNQELINSFNSTNSPLNNVGINSMDSDENGTLWILDASSSQGVKALSYDHEWVSLSYNSLDNRSDSRKIIALQNGDKWVLRGLGSTLFAFNENGTLSNNDDDVTSTFSVRDENNSSISSQIYDITEDQDGSVWVGTSSGVAIYGDPGTIFRDGSFFAYRPIITIDGSTQFLLSTEKVQSIAVNGANQKWLGTENSGAFLVSENGDEQLAQFNSLNSPLPSNNIQKISVNPGTGEVFFLTDKGMVSYRGKVTEGTENYNDLYVYPNPVRETYRGDITVSGLMSNSTVKITNVSGNLVWEGKSEGGQFIWDGRNFKGSRVHTGVYLIFCSNSDGSKSKVIKLLFIN
ncbi:two-component regulator propeller domain-containing protein [Marinifilum caeruleilacunae]|uniref:T9SS type A sorting domain-containing protein n=1 Tax=Marinifilum caeruleilacunae TaxID=2499076 RepID=A0ABX1WUX3_9BACT|nr:two-component regulator propeller domain-containing protein [Marinifilum caeruleilacunae]NOU59908.1 T9SS type A sorting domain-containing protein [Marinifilum caeruleilacunae]